MFTMRAKAKLMLFLLLFLPITVYAQQSLSRIHQGIAEEYRDIGHIGAGELLAMSPLDVVLFDVRELKEFNVSHVDGAIQVDPDMDSDTFAQLYGARLEGKTAVFYCSVGRRSSQLASELNEYVFANSGAGALNLIGGIFQWRNENRPLMGNDNLATDQVHPYNWYWGRLIEDKDAISYQPNTD